MVYSITKLANELYFECQARKYQNSMLLTGRFSEMIIAVCGIMPPGATSASCSSINDSIRLGVEEIAIRLASECDLGSHTTMKFERTPCEKARGT